MEEQINEKEASNIVPSNIFNSTCHFVEET